MVTRRTQWHGALALAACAAAASCAGLGEAMVGPEEPVEESEGYLESAGGPQTSVDLGDGGEHLLTRFQKVLAKNSRLKEDQRELQDEVTALRTKLERETADKETEQQQRAGAEADAERLRQIKGDREAKILHLQLQLTELQRSKLQLEIAAIERQLEAVDHEAKQAPAKPPTEGR